LRATYEVPEWIAERLETEDPTLVAKATKLGSVLADTCPDVDD
jgi:hypothetical protein